MRKITLALLLFCFTVSAIVPTPASAGESILAVQSGTYSPSIACPTGCTGPQTGRSRGFFGH
jgi:hypothetical protein